ncbi:right-handed parallel beta-helix repeat-containing protein [Hymenobacter properus]|uniref:Right-handed parallel beta-helix repeat-containing protein n=1 Tax=Hymenobacter properus TaxID=2791026 RepID=A0A931FJT8_9BACT|nr:right-handed parallel beta-helix repeat-containing protein [Hymenobacter properus]MBF9140341.1 right-handed parallel beta-helix repeat-containing protein [Hymenobacter properus]MBR7719148.1 right-handed parallel beta-helix repeat-containing protein [Microvirga sp. SRT04]
MKNLVQSFLLGIVLLAAAPNAHAQLGGIRRICPPCVGPVDYPSFTAAVTALNAAGVAPGGVTFMVVGGNYNEIVPPITVSGTAAGPIIFQKSGTGTNPKITGTGTGTTDAVLTLDGADYVQFIGIDVEDNSANTTAAQQLENGILLQNGATNNTFRDATITLNRANTNRTNGVAMLNGGNNNNHFYGLTVQNCSYGYDLEGTATLPDEGTEIGPFPGPVAGFLLPSRVLSIGVPPAGTPGGIAFSTYGIYLSRQTNARVSNTEVNGVTGTSGVYGIYSTGTTNSVDVTDCRVHALSGSGTTGIVMGYYVGSGTTHRFLRNKAYDIEALGTSGFAAGFDITSGTNNYLANNMIYDVRAAASGAGTSVRAFSFRGGNSYAYHNTVVVSYAATNPANKSGALYMSGGQTVDLRNNIFVNLVSGLPTGGGGIAAAFFKNNTVMTSLATGTNNNIYYAGPPSDEKPIFYGAAVGTTPAGLDQTLAQYKARVPTVEQASLTELPPFVNATTDPHLQAGQPTRAEGGGTSLTATSLPVTTDIDFDTRNATRPDIGADEGSFTPLAARAELLVDLMAELAPNPTSRGTVPMLYLSGPAKLLSLTIIDALGRTVAPAQTVHHTAGTEALALPTGLTSGLYVLRLRELATGAALTRQLVVE